MAVEVQPHLPDFVPLEHGPSWQLLTVALEWRSSCCLGQSFDHDLLEILAENTEHEVCWARWKDFHSPVVKVIVAFVNLVNGLVDTEKSYRAELYQTPT